MNLKVLTSPLAFQLTLSTLEAAGLFHSLRDGDPVKEVLRRDLAPSQPNLSKLLETFKWNGASFPVEDCFDALKGQAPESEHDELRRLIKARAVEYNSHLE